MSADIAPLLARIRAATRRDDRLDLDLIKALLPWQDSDRMLASGFSITSSPTGSIDAAAALVRAAIPGAVIRIEIAEDGSAEVTIIDPADSRCFDAEAATPALALCVALVMWKQAQLDAARGAGGAGCHP